MAFKYALCIDEYIEDVFDIMIKEYNSKYSLIPKRLLSSRIARQDRAVLLLMLKTHGMDSDFFEKNMKDLWGFITKTDSIIDIKEDIKNGIINISLEDTLMYGWSLEEILSSDIEDLKDFNIWMNNQRKEVLCSWYKFYNIIYGRKIEFPINLILNIGIKDIKKKLEE